MLFISSFAILRGFLPIKAVEGPWSGGGIECRVRAEARSCLDDEEGRG